MLKRTIAVFSAAVIATLAGASLLASPAFATDDCRTVTTNFVDHEDWGNGSPQHWADDTFTRVTTVCHVPDPEPTVKKESLVVPVPGWVYSVAIADTGTFTTVGGDNSPNNDHQVLLNVPGTLEGSYKTFVLAPSEWQFWNASLNNSTIPEGAHPRTGEFVESLFTQGDETSKQVWYKWVYKTCNEQWVDASFNHDGQDNSAGDITGYSRLSCPVVTTKNNCDHTQVITLANNASWEKAEVVFKADDVVYELGGGESTTIDVAAGVEKTIVLVKGREGFKIFTTVVWEQPDGCTTPTPSPSAPPTSTSCAYTDALNACVNGSDLNCDQFTDNRKPLVVNGNDPSNLDSDNDGIACEVNDSGGLAVTGTPIGGTAIAAGVFGIGALLVGGVLWLRKRRQSLSS